jgi:hypothetical protein
MTLAVAGAVGGGVSLSCAQRDCCAGGSSRGDGARRPLWGLVRGGVDASSLSAECSARPAQPAHRGDGPQGYRTFSPRGGAMRPTPLPVQRGVTVPVRVVSRGTVLSGGVAAPRRLSGSLSPHRGVPLAVLLPVACPARSALLRSAHPRAVVVGDPSSGPDRPQATVPVGVSPLVWPFVPALAGRLASHRSQSTGVGTTLGATCDLVKPCVAKRGLSVAGVRWCDKVVRSVNTLVPRLVA